jgi:phospholipase/carboxylesterase
MPLADDVDLDSLAKRTERFTGADLEIPALHARAALQHLGVLHGDATLDVAEGVAHELHPALIDRALHRLHTHIPHRTWQAALGAVPPKTND